MAHAVDVGFQFFVRIEGYPGGKGFVVADGGIVEALSPLGAGGPPEQACQHAALDLLSVGGKAVYGFRTSVKGGTQQGGQAHG